MKKLLATLLMGMLILPAGSCLADTVYYVETTDYKPSLLDKIEDSTQDMAEDVGEATVDAAHKTGAFVKDKSKKAADATGKAVKKGAKKTGDAVKSGAKKAGNAAKEGAKKAGKATKKGAIKATNWSATKVRNGAQKVIIKTEEATTTTETVPATVEE